MITTQSEAEAKSWQTAMRHKLGIEPDASDPYSRLLMAHIEGSDDQDEAAERIEFDLGELQKALRIVRES